MTPVAKHAASYAGEIGFNLRSICGSNPKVPVIYPFVRYEYYNPQEGGEAGQTMEIRNKVSMWTAGLNWRVLPNLVVKADYTTRQIGLRQDVRQNRLQLQQRERVRHRHCLRGLVREEISGEIDIY